jgi:hypothetical protein
MERRCRTGYGEQTEKKPPPFLSRGRIRQSSWVPYRDTVRRAPVSDKTLFVIPFCAYAASITVICLDRLVDRVVEPQLPILQQTAALAVLA